MNSLDALNTSNQRIRDCMLGKWKDEIPATGVFIWVDVRDLALAHVLAIENEAAANQRFFITTGTFCNRAIADVLAKNFPQLKDLPSAKTPGGGMPEGGMFSTDVSNTDSKLKGWKQRDFETSITDTVKSLQAVGG